MEEVVAEETLDIVVSKNVVAGRWCGGGGGGGGVRQAWYFWWWWWVPSTGVLVVTPYSALHAHSAC